MCEVILGLPEYFDVNFKDVKKDLKSCKIVKGTLNTIVKIRRSEMEGKT